MEGTEISHSIITSIAAQYVSMKNMEIGALWSVGLLKQALETQEEAVKTLIAAMPDIGNNIDIVA